jgi:hypothetical protein
MAQEAVRCYILTADEHSWKTSLSFNLWGLSERTKGSWNTTQVGDWVAFYVTRPIGKIVGFGKVASDYVKANRVTRISHEMIRVRHPNLNYRSEMEDVRNGLRTEKPKRRISSCYFDPWKQSLDVIMPLLNKGKIHLLLSALSTFNLIQWLTRIGSRFLMNFELT